MNIINLIVDSLPAYIKGFFKQEECLWVAKTFVAANFGTWTWLGSPILLTLLLAFIKPFSSICHAPSSGFCRRSKSVPIWSARRDSLLGHGSTFRNWFQPVCFAFWRFWSWSDFLFWRIMSNFRRKLLERILPVRPSDWQLICWRFCSCSWLKDQVRLILFLTSFLYILGRCFRI